MTDELPDPLAQAVAQVRATTPPTEALNRSLERANQLERAMFLRRRFLRRVSALAATAALLLLGAGGWLLLKPSDSWAQHLQEMRERPWIHGIAKDRDGTVGREFWFAPAKLVSAMRAGDAYGYFDHRLKITERYDSNTKELVRAPATEHDRAETTAFQAVLQGIGKQAAQLESPVPLWEVTDKRKRQVDEGNRRWEEYELNLSLRAEGGNGQKMRLTFRVDPRNRLPVEMRIQPLDAAGQPREALTFALEYPAEGPKDIYALGVPKDAKVVDTIPKGDLARLVNAVKAGRDRLDNYVAVCFEWPSYGTDEQRKKRDENWHRSFHVSRITRKGDKIRIELGLPNSAKQPAAPAEGENLVEWWHKQSHLYRFQTTFLCDGKETYNPEQGPNGELLPTLKSVQRIRPGEGLQVALGSGNRQDVVEGYAYPDLMVPSELFDTEVIEKPANGPPGTVLIHAKARRQLQANAFNDMKYWIDPKHSYALVRSTMEMHGPNGPINRDQWVDHRMERFEVSPHGVWFPTIVRWKNSVGIDKERGDQCRRYILEFPPQIPDDAFKAK